MIDGCNIWDLMIKVILPMTKPVIATVVIFNVLYIWNEFPFASVMLRDVSDYTLSMGASFFKGTYTVDYINHYDHYTGIDILWNFPEEYCGRYDSRSG